MDSKIKKCCPNCSQFYQLKSLHPQAHGNVPLFLSCGHSMCENCICNIVKFGEPIECKVCLKDMEVPTDDITLLVQSNLHLYKIFPVNISLLGELALEQIQPAIQETNKIDTDYFGELQSILQSPDNIEEQCMECHNPTTKMCKQCETILCNSCFVRIHKNFVVFKNHTLQNIESFTSVSTCKTHKDKPLEYHCKDCSKAICMDCMIVSGEKSCKNHNVVSMQEMNEGFLQELTDITPTLEETYKRLTKTAVDLGHILHNMDNEVGTSDLSHIIQDIQQHFSKLSASVQKHKNEVIDTIIKLQTAEHESLEKAKSEVASAVKLAKNTLKAVKSLDGKNLQPVNIFPILENAKKIISAPWYLNKDDTSEDLKVTSSEDLVVQINDYVKLEGNANIEYKLLTTAELNEKNIDIPPPPTCVVQPPQLPRDVRQIKKSKPEKERDQKPMLYTQVPKFRSKSGSCSSLNSINSETSNQSFENSGKHQQNQYGNQESFHTKPLHEGGQELVYISHIVDPHNFFVQRVSDQPHVQSLQRELRNTASMPKPSVNRVTEGKFYLVYNKADKMWQRCRVVKIEKKDSTDPRFHVFCVDFGSTEIASITKLRLLPPARVNSPPPFAMNCSLANCEPINGAWTSEDAILMQNIIDNKQAGIHVRRIRPSSEYLVTYECDVTAFEDGVSLAHALVFHERAKMPSPKLPYPKFMCGVEKLKLYVSHNDFKSNTVEEVFVTHIISPDNFYVRKEHLQEVYEKLSADLEQEYNFSSNSENIYLPENGMVCAVRTEEGWARGVVRETPGRGRVRVWLPDTGALLLLPWTALRRLQPRFASLRALAVQCHLAGITPLNKHWSNGSVNLFKLYKNRLVDLHVEDDRDRASLGVILYDNSDPEDVICINEEMIKHKFAVSFGIFTFNKNKDFNDQVITNKTPLDKPVQRPQKKQSKDTVTLLKKTKAFKPTRNAEELEAKDKGPLRLEIKVLHYQSPSLFYVSLIHQQKTFNELFDKMQKYYSKIKDEVKGKTNWQVGDRCCTVCVQSKTWRRAAILEIQEDNAKLFYSDFACIETVPISSLRELTKDFASIGDAAFKCHLSGVIPAVGDEWPSLTKEFLKELIDAYKRIFITKIGNFKDKSMPVELWVYHTVQGGALEPNTSEWRCLNMKIIEQGLGIPDKSQQFDTQKNSDGSDENVLSFLNMTGSVDDWLQLEQLPLKPLDLKKALKSDTESNSHPDTPVDINSAKPEDNFQNSNTIFISDWLPPEPLPVNEFIGMPTYVDNNGIIYLHSIDQQDTLDLIRKALDVRFKNPDPKAKFAKWTVGEPCIALYYLDNRFYRGKVLEVNNEEASCLIHYIDYGNEEKCSFVNLRKSIALHQIPTQAHKCVLNRIRPVGKLWDRHTLDYIHKSIVEKKCFVKVDGPAVGSVIPVELKFDKLWINDHLVEFEMAVYNDGSKPLLRKFVPDCDNTILEETCAADSDSGPDYILEDENSIVNQSNKSFDMEDFKSKDWNELLEDYQEEMKQTCLTFPKQSVDDFLCNITIINDAHILELTRLCEDDQSDLYEEMHEKLREDALNMSPLNGIFENKACIAIFPEDKLWYRASILQYSEVKKLIKVKFVDYGNVEVISPDDVREITEEYMKLPPLTVSVTLSGVKINPDVELSVITEEYTNTLLDKGPFQCKIIEYNDAIPEVELRNEKGELVYESLIEKKIFLVT